MKTKAVLIFLIIVMCICLYVVYSSYRENTNERYNPNKKIAFMFLIYDEINQEELWKKFFEKADKNKYNIYIHFKNHKKSDYFDRFKLKQTVDTKWGDKSLVEAHNLLLKEALKDVNNEHFVLLSNSCVPLKTFDHIYNYLKQDYSYYGMIDEWNKTERNTYAELFIPSKYICKAHQWSILNRKHGQLLVDKEKEYIDWFPIVPDEHAHITFLYYNHLHNEIKKTHKDDENTTYTFWYDHRDNSPQEYLSISNDDVTKLVNTPCLFGRKFNKNCKLDFLAAMIKLKN